MRKKNFRYFNFKTSAKKPSALGAMVRKIQVIKMSII